MQLVKAMKQTLVKQVAEAIKQCQTRAPSTAASNRAGAEQPADGPASSTAGASGAWHWLMYKEPKETG